MMRCRPSLVRGRAAQVNPGGFTTPARRPSVPHRTAGCGKSSLRPLMAASSPLIRGSTADKVDGNFHPLLSPAEAKFSGGAKSGAKFRDTQKPSGIKKSSHR
ncbi:hypothetical protein FY041_16905 [Pseudomonas monteilii]|nr:hypothetical protein FY041_16905 [Pseudomonas monteilii]QIG24553.1 hypothetical protein FY043_16900 [Pseudomonas monteilii]